MQLATALRLPALAIQLSNVVKTLVLFATNMPTRTAYTTAIASAMTPQTIPAMAWPEFVAPLARPRETAMPPRIAATRPPSRARGNKTKDTAATRLATPTTRAATAIPFPGRVADGAYGWADPGSWVSIVISPVVSTLTLDGREHITATTLAKRCTGGLFRGVPVSGPSRHLSSTLGRALEKGSNPSPSPPDLHTAHIPPARGLCPLMEISQVRQGRRRPGHLDFSGTPPAVWRLGAGDPGLLRRPGRLRAGVRRRNRNRGNRR